MLLVSQVCAGRKNYIHFEINGSASSLEWNGEEANILRIGQRNRANELLCKDPVLMDSTAARYAGVPGGLEEGYLDTFKNIFSDVYTYIRNGAVPGNDAASFPTFKTGYEQLCIVDAVMKSSVSGAWEKVAY